MIPNYYFERFEELHNEYYALRRSQEFRIGTKIFNLIKAYKQKRFFSYLRQEWIYMKNSHLTISQQISDFKYGKYPNSKVKIAVYSCITGMYDQLIEPYFNVDQVDYIMFTDNEDLKSDKWELRHIPEEVAKLGDCTLINRYIKMHPAILGNCYDYALYVDGNICVVSNVRNMINAINPQTGLALHRHSSRDCIYDELKACNYIKRGNTEKLKKQVELYCKKGFPKHYGLLEATIILSDMHNYRAIELLDKWWIVFLASQSRRDQIALPYVLWENGIQVTEIGNLGNNIQLNPKFRKYKHAEGNGKTDIH